MDKNAPRTIDIDILIYGDLVIKQEELVLPDPEIQDRDFLAIPLAELAPGFVLPGTKQTLGELSRGFGSSPIMPLEEYTAELRRRLAA